MVPTSSREAGGVGGGGDEEDEEEVEEEKEAEEGKRGTEGGEEAGLWSSDMSSSERMLSMTLSSRPLPLRA